MPHRVNRHPLRHSLVVMAAAAIVLSNSTPAAAADWEGPTYELDPRIDVPMLLAPATFVVAWLLQNELAPAHCAPLCNEVHRSNINALDRPAAGNYDTNWRLVTDITELSTIGLSAIALVVDEGFVDGLNDAVVIGQSVLWTTGLAIVANMAARRPRPFMYSDEAPEDERLDPDGGLSFISGHVGVTAALTTSMFSTFRRRDPDGALQWVALGTGTAATGVVATGRVLSGDHFPTDVLLGAALGGSMGFLIPALHDTPLCLIAAPADDGGYFAGTLIW